MKFKTFSIVRPINLLIVALIMLLILVKYKDDSFENYWLNAIILTLTVILTTAAGYVINDIKDIDCDAINKPNKNVVNNFISIKNAYLLYFSLICVSILMSWWFSYELLIIVSIANLVLFLYSFWLQKLPFIGNLVVAALSTVVLSVCLFMINLPFKTDYYILGGYLLFSFFVSLIREIIKDMEDMEGDKLSNFKTFPIMFGVNASKALVYSFAGIQLFLCIIYSFFTYNIGLKSTAIIMGIIAISFFLVINFVAKARQKEDYHRISLFLKILMFFGVINLFFI